MILICLLGGGGGGEYNVLIRQSSWAAQLLGRRAACTAQTTLGERLNKFDKKF